MKIKNTFIVSMFLVFIPLFLTGCKTEIMKSPEKLLEKPISNDFNYKIYTEIRKLTPIDTSFVLPKNTNDVGRISITDLNNDGSSQVITFKKKVNEDQGIGSIYMYIFENKGSSIIDDSEKMIRVSGESIKSVNFVDLKNNGKKQIVLHVANRGFENIYVYEYTNHNIKRIADFSTSNYSIKLNFAKYNKNGKKICLALLQDNKNYDVFISKMTLNGNDLNFEKYGTIKNVDGLEKVDFINGKVSENKYGTILVYQSFPGNIISQIIVYEDNKFITALDEKDVNIKNIIFMKPQDINRDYILDIPKVEFRFTNNTPKESNVISWYQWNGNYKNKTNNLKLVRQIYYCYNYNFQFKIPNDLKNKFFIHQYFNDRKSVFSFYEKSFEDDKTLLFKVDVIQRTAEDVESKSKTKKIENIILEDENYKYVFEPINKDLLEKYNINSNTIKKLLTFINK